MALVNEPARAADDPGTAPEAPPSAPLPSWLSQKLIALGLRTEIGREVWETYALDRLADHPWLAGGVRFRPGPGEIVPAPRAPAQNGRT